MLQILMENLKAIKLSTTPDCIIVTESEAQLLWCQTPHILSLLYSRCQDLFGSIDNVYIVCHPIYDMALYGKVDILSVTKPLSSISN